jgi:GntR family transcriptional regulator of arabinose operon
MRKNKTISSRGKDASHLLRYEQAKHAVELFIHQNGLKPGDRIPTEAELRAQFGWSRVTINRALNELVWEGVLRRVQGSGTYVAKPQRLERALRIMVSARPYHQQDDYCNPLFAGIREEASTQQEVDIVYHSETPVPSVEAVYKLGVDGVLALSWELDDLAPVLRLHQAGVRVVGLALRSRICPLPLVYMDNYGGILNAMEYLLERGHQRIAFVTMRIENSDVYERLLAYHAAMAQARLPVDPALLLLSNDTLADALMEHWWRGLESPPSAILLHGTVAAPMISILQRHGFHIPHDLSIIVIDDLQNSRHFVPSLTALSQSPYQLGRRGLEKLIQMLRGEDEGQPEMLPTELIVRDSVLARPAEPAYR